MRKKKVLLIITALFLIGSGIMLANLVINEDRGADANSAPSSNNPSSSPNGIGNTTDVDPEECKPPNMPLTLKDASEVLGEKLRMFSHKPIKYGIDEKEGYECIYFNFNPDKFREVDVYLYNDDDSGSAWLKRVSPKYLSTEIEGIGDEAYTLIPDTHILVKKGNKFIEIKIRTDDGISESENEEFLRELAKRAVSKM